MAADNDKRVPFDQEDIEKRIKALTVKKMISNIAGGAVGIADRLIGTSSTDGYQGPTFISGLQPAIAGALDTGIQASAGTAGRDLQRIEDERLEKVIEDIRAQVASGKMSTRAGSDMALQAMRDSTARVRNWLRTLAPLMNPARKVEGTDISDVNKKKIKENDSSDQAYAAMKLLRSGVELSDEDWKELSSFDAKDMAKAMINHGRPFNGHDIQFLHELAKANKGEDYAKDISDVGIWSPDTLEGYAKFIKNSHYTYKPEAVQIDASIDPQEEHIGPMAQEIEKVNPACIEETPEGVKQVDTSRLSLMTAGVVGDLARLGKQHDTQLEDINETLKNIQQLLESKGVDPKASMHEILHAEVA